MKTRILVLAAIFAVLAMQPVFADDAGHSIELRIHQKSVQPGKPVMAEIIVKNATTEHLPLYTMDTQFIPQMHPLLSYRIDIVSLSNDSINQSTVGPLIPAKLGRYSEVPVRSEMCLWTFNVIEIFGNIANFQPGLYKLTAEICWPGYGGGTAEGCFLIEQPNTDTAVLNAIKDVNTNVMYTQDKVNTVKASVETLKQNLAAVKTIIDKMYALFIRVYMITPYRWIF